MNATLDLFQEDGKPLVVKIGTQQASTFNFSVKPRGAVSVTTADTGPAKIGWARLKPDKPLEATAVFTLLQAGGSAAALSASPLAAGDFLSEVGVDSTVPRKRGAKVFADSILDRDTAIAVSNSTNAEVSYSFSLYDKNNQFIKFVGGLKLPPFGHKAAFMTEFFKDVVPAPGKTGPDIREFEGRVEAFCADCAIGTLRLAGTFLTSLPTLLELHGFKPTTTVELHSELGGTMPSGAFKIQQFDNDLVLDSVEVSIPEVGFDNTLFKNASSPVIFGDTGGTLGNATLTLGVVDSIAPDGSVKLNLKQFNLDRETLREAVLQETGTMTLSGSPNSGFKAVLQFRSNPRSFIGDDFFFQLLMPPTVLKLPAGGSTLHSVTRLTSVSTRLQTDSRLVETDRQDIVLPSFPAGAPQILFINPFQGRSQAPLFLQGNNLAANTSDIQVFFASGLAGSELPAEIVSRNGNQLLVDVPDGIKTGPVKIRQRGQESNPYYRVIFDPQDQFTLASRANNTAVNFATNLSQEKGEFAYLSWQIDVDQGSLKLTGLAVDQGVGKGKLTRQNFGTTNYDVKVDSVGADNVILKLVQPAFSSPDYRFKLSNKSGGGILIENVFTSEPLVPLFVTATFKLEWETSTPLLQLPAGAGKTVTANVTKSSGRAGVAADVKYFVYSTRSTVTE